MEQKIGECKNCHNKKTIVNSHFGLCLVCNNTRLKKNKTAIIKQNLKKEKVDRKSYIVDSGKKANYLVDRGTLIITGGRSVGKNLFLDELFYEECFNTSDHKCEECGTPLNTDFRDATGRIVARWRYSHIIPKSIAPELRHNVKNINHLCLDHHTQWDFGDKKSMNIYNKNKLIFPGHLK